MNPTTLGDRRYAIINIRKVVADMEPNLASYFLPHDATLNGGLNHV